MTSLAASLRSSTTIALGRAARTAARLRGGGSGGTALPGLVMEKTDPGFLARVLSALPRGVVVVSGTNGKTTTTKMVVQLLQSQGLRVVTNRTGSNFVRGVLASLLTEVDRTGRLDADIAVFELDEAHAVRFIQRVRPRATLLLNVMRDQLDRFGEVDYTASLLHHLAQATSDVVVVNGDDPRLSSPEFLSSLTAQTACFAIGEAVRSTFLSDDDLHAHPRDRATAQAPSTLDAGSVSVRLDDIRGHEVTLCVRGVTRQVHLSIPGIHNQLNACAALALALEILGPTADVDGLLDELSRVEAAFGRGEVLMLDGREVELALVKNPAGFRMSLLTAAQDSRSAETIMVAINDEYADGRDMSWLWDVEFASLQASGVAVVSGVRAWDMALRLHYDDVAVETVEPDLSAALDAVWAASAHTGQRVRIFASYTAMLALRQRLGQLTEVEEVMS